DLKNTFTVGDSFRDLEAAMAKHSQPVLVKTGKGERTLKEKKSQIENNHIPVFADLAEFVNHLLVE
ncbi:MAG: HAD hydrolase-like protein, partial [Gammaproteobacteria bacterium]|nr:HAD hydrolase-like protein [Gammaproteobacteria bacterium]